MLTTVQAAQIPNSHVHGPSILRLRGFLDEFHLIVLARAIRRNGNPNPPVVCNAKPSRVGLVDISVPLVVDYIGFHTMQYSISKIMQQISDLHAAVQTRIRSCQV